MYSYRDAQVNDFEQIIHFPQNEDELFFMFPRASYPLTVSEFKECALARIEPTVFLYNDEIAGYANIIKIEGTHSGTVGNIIVAAAYRGKGIGKYILNTMSIKLKDNYSVKELRLACFSTNISGLILYKRYGLLPYAMDISTDNKGNTAMLLRMKKDL